MGEEMKKLDTCLVRVILGIYISATGCLGATNASHTISIFGSLQEVKQYAQTLPEYPQTDTNDLTNPSFETFYRSRNGGVFQKMVRFFRQDVWRQAEFKKLVEAVVAMRENSGLKGRFVNIVPSGPDRNYFFITELSGTFHALVRCLESLKNEGVIDDALKIVKPDSYIVFNGNTFTGFAYGIDTCTLVSRLLYNNPNNIICVRGALDDKSQWEQSSFGQEVKCRLSSYELMRSLITRLIDTFPLAVYLVANRTENTTDLVGIFSDESLVREFEEQNKTQCFLDPNMKIMYLDKQESKNRGLCSMRAVLTAAQCTKDAYTQAQGLQKISLENNIITWAMVSGPTRCWRVLNQFFYEGFVRLTASKDLAQWALTLYNDDIRNTTNIVPRKIYNLLTGKEYINPEIIKVQSQAIMEQKKNVESALEFALNDFQVLKSKISIKRKEKAEPEKIAAPVEEKGMMATNKEAIVFGSIMDLSRNQRGISEQSIGGIELAFDAINKNGGVHNRKLSLTVLDDQYDPQKARDAAITLMDQYKIYQFIMPLGSPTLESYIDFVKSGSLLVLFPNTGSSAFRNPQLKKLINFRASYAQEGSVLAHYAIEKLNAKKIVLFYQKDVESIDGILEYFKGINFNNYVEVVYLAKETNFSRQIQQISQSQADSILFLSLPSTTLELIRQMGVQNLIGKNLLGWSDLMSETFQNFARSRGLKKIVISSVLPNPHTSAMPIVKQYRKATDAKGLIKDGDSLEGYINASILIEILKKIDEPITHEKIIGAAESFSKFNLGGITLNFEPESRSLAQAIWLDIGAEDWQEIPLYSDREAKQAVEQVQTEKEKKEKQREGVVAVGCTLDLSKSDKIMGGLIKHVLDAFFDLINREKAFGAHTFKMAVLDDEYSVSKARENVQRLIKDNDVQALLIPVGSANLQGYLDLVNAGKVDVLFPQADSPVFHKSDMKNIINFSASSFEVGYTMVRQAFKKSNIQKIALFYETATGGILEGAKKALEELHVKNISEVSFTASDVDYSMQVKKIKNENPDALMFLSGITPAASLLQLLGADFLVGKILIGGSIFLNIDSFKKNLHNKGLVMLIPSLVPNPKTDNLPIVKDFRAFAKTYAIEEEPVSLQAYIASRIFVEIIKRIDGPVTKRKIIETAEQFKGVDLGGITLTFDPQTRRLINNIWVDDDSVQWPMEPIEGVVKAGAV
jgi:ABC-type branched-subunit amino acid transport system substrate-binding protein